MQTSTYKVYAIRYASIDRRTIDNFLVHDIADPHETMPMDFYFWLITDGEHHIAVDTGFSADASQRRNRPYRETPEQSLNKLGIAPSSISDLILTHLHYDHAGNCDLFPSATLHVQEREMNFATGKHMCHRAMNHFFEVDDVVNVLHRVFEGRVRFHNGDSQVAPGIELYLAGGHTPGLQMVRVNTERGWIVLASDALHYYRNYEEANPFPAIFHVGDMLDAYDRLNSLADSADHIVPGHDPEVARRYPEFTAKSDIFCLHKPPCTTLQATGY